MQAGCSVPRSTRSSRSRSSSINISSKHIPSAAAHPRDRSVLMALVSPPQTFFPISLPSPQPSIPGLTNSCTTRRRQWRACPRRWMTPAADSTPLGSPGFLRPLQQHTSASPDVGACCRLRRASALAHRYRWRRWQHHDHHPSRAAFYRGAAITRQRRAAGAASIDEPPGPFRRQLQPRGVQRAEGRLAASSSSSSHPSTGSFRPVQRRQRQLQQ